MIMIISFVQMREYKSTQEDSSGTLDSFGESKLSFEGLILLLKLFI